MKGTDPFGLQEYNPVGILEELYRNGIQCDAEMLNYSFDALYADTISTTQPPCSAAVYEHAPFNFLHSEKVKLKDSHSPGPIGTDGDCYPLRR